MRRSPAEILQSSAPNLAPGHPVFDHVIRKAMDRLSAEVHRVMYAPPTLAFVSDPALPQADGDPRPL